MLCKLCLAFIFLLVAWKEKEEKNWHLGYSLRLSLFFLSVSLSLSLCIYLSLYSQHKKFYKCFSGIHFCCFCEADNLLWASLFLLRSPLSWLGVVCCLDSHKAKYKASFALLGWSLLPAFLFAQDEGVFFFLLSEFLSLLLLIPKNITKDSSYTSSSSSYTQTLFLASLFNKSRW